MYLSNATVYDNRGWYDQPDNGGGPIRRSPLVTMPSGEGIRSQSSTIVNRTPTTASPWTEPGGARVPGIDHMKFLPDGRLVRAGALGGSLGGAFDAEWREVWIFTGASAVGLAALGALTSYRPARGAAIGAATAAVFGLAVVLARKAANK